MKTETTVWIIDDLRDALAMIARSEAGERDADDTLYLVKEKILDALDWLEEDEV